MYKMNNCLSIVGFGKLGSAMGVCFAEKGYDVLAYDKNPNLIKKFKSFKIPFKEKKLSQLFKKNYKKITFEENINTLINKTDTSFLIVPTPSNTDGSYSLEYIFDCIDDMSLALNKKKRHNLVLTSTVMPQSCNNEIIPYIKKKIKKCSINFYYSPEFISIGNIIEEFINPRLVLIGSNNTKKVSNLIKIYKTVCGPNVKIFNTSIENIEIAKMAVNCTMTTRISLMNTFSEVCEKTKNSDIDNVGMIIKEFFLNFDKGFLAGLPYGGPCLPRDNIAMGSYLESKNIENNIPKATDNVNNNIVSNIYKILKKKKVKKLLILGLTYKNDTPETTKSAAFDLIMKIKDKIDITVYDETLNDIDNDLIKNIKKIKNLKTEIYCHETIIIMKNKNYLKNYNLNEKVLIIDPWRLYKNRFIKNKNYIPLGINYEY